MIPKQTLTFAQIIKNYLTKRHINITTKSDANIIVAIVTNAQIGLNAQEKAESEL